MRCQRVGRRFKPGQPLHEDCMANKHNHRRVGARRTEGGRVYGCHSKHGAALGRRRWLRIETRQFRRITKMGTMRRHGQMISNTIQSCHWMRNPSLRMFREDCAQEA